MKNISQIKAKRDFHGLLNKFENNINSNMEISCSKRDYIELQEQLFNNIDVQEIYKKAENYYHIK
jgi:hypothetical protein